MSAGNQMSLIILLMSSGTENKAEEIFQTTYVKWFKTQDINSRIIYPGVIFVGQKIKKNLTFFWSEYLYMYI